MPQFRLTLVLDSLEEEEYRPDWLAPMAKNRCYEHQPGVEFPRDDIYTDRYLHIHETFEKPLSKSGHETRMEATGTLSSHQVQGPNNDTTHDIIVYVKFAVDSKEINKLYEEQVLYANKMVKNLQQSKIIPGFHGFFAQVSRDSRVRRALSMYTCEPIQKFPIALSGHGPDISAKEMMQMLRCVLLTETCYGTRF